MNTPLAKYIILSLSLIVFSCSSIPHQASSQDNPETADAGQVNADTAPVPNKDLLADVEQDEVIVGLVDYYGCDDALDCYFGNNPVDDSEVPDEPKNGHAVPDDPEPAEHAEADAQEVNDEKGQTLLDGALDFINSSQEYWSEGNLDQAIATLDEAYMLLMKVDTYANPELVQQQEDLRFMISKRILEIYASRYTAVTGNHHEIPLTMNEYVEKEIKRFSGPERKFFIESYRRSGRYMENIQKALKEAGLPGELGWLPLIESGFKVKALSRARALGLWQFIPSTGYKFGLKRDMWIDERLDPDKSTAAAIAYLKELHKIFGDWTTVLAGYNCGEGTVLKKIRNQRINYLDNFWDLFQQLPYETARYVPRFLATLHILKNPEKYGFDLEGADKPVDFETVSVSKPMQLKTVAGVIGVSQKDLAGLNPELRRKATPPAAYVLKVPDGRKNVLLAHMKDIPAWSLPRSSFAYHRVRKGETLSLIALRYHTSVSRIVRANNIHKRHFIRIGQKLKIPLRNASGRYYASSGVKLLPGSKYKVRKGDSLWLIAKRFRTNTKSLKSINELTSTRLQVGQILRINRK